MVSGNHDVGLKRWHNPSAHDRHVLTFGQTNYKIHFQRKTGTDFELVIIDSIALLNASGEAYTTALQFIQNIIKETSGNSTKRILFTHIPLFRPSNVNCGPRRDKASIPNEQGVSYQNLLPASLSSSLLATIHPDLVFR